MKQNYQPSKNRQPQQNKKYKDFSEVMKESFQFFRTNYSGIMQAHQSLKNETEMPSAGFNLYYQFDNYCRDIADGMDKNASRRLLEETLSILQGKNLNTKLITLSQRMNYIANRQTNAWKAQRLALELSKLSKFLSEKDPKAAEMPLIIMEGVICYVR